MAGQWRNCGQFQAWIRNFSFLHNIQFGLGAQPAPYSVDVGDVFLRVKLAMA
jgi:hypothetical protein